MSHLFYPAFFSYQADVAEGLGIQFKSMVILDNNLCNNIHYSDTINPTFFKILKKKVRKKNFLESVTQQFPARPHTQIKSTK